MLHLRDFSEHLIKKTHLLDIFQLPVPSASASKPTRNTKRIQTGGRCITRGDIAVQILEKAPAKSKFKPPYKSTSGMYPILITELIQYSICTYNLRLLEMPHLIKDNLLYIFLATNIPTHQTNSQEAGPSRPPPTDTPGSEDDDDQEVCCQCKLWSPPGLKRCNNLVIVQWAQCDKCDHWVHLRFCTSVTVVRDKDAFFCQCCQQEE